MVYHPSLSYWDREGLILFHFKILLKYESMKSDFFIVYDGCYQQIKTIKHKNTNWFFFFCLEFHYSLIRIDSMPDIHPNDCEAFLCSATQNSSGSDVWLHQPKFKTLLERSFLPPYLLRTRAMGPGPAQVPACWGDDRNTVRVINEKNRVCGRQKSEKVVTHFYLLGDILGRGID